MSLDKDSLKIYELFNGSNKKYDNPQAYYAIHALHRLYLDLDNKKDSKDIKKIVSPFLSDFTIHPYLMLEKLADGEEKEVMEFIFKDITTNLFPNENFARDIIRRVEYPSLDMPFMKNLLSVISSGRNNESFGDSKKAKKLFLLYGEKSHLGIVLDQLKSYADSYHEANDNCRESDDE